MPLRHKYIHLKPFEWCRDVRLSGWSFRSISVLKMLRCRATMFKLTFLYVEIRFRLATQYRHLPNVSLVCTRYDYVRLSLDCYLCYNTIFSSGVARGSPGKLTCNVQYWDQKFRFHANVDRLSEPGLNTEHYISISHVTLSRHHWKFSTVDSPPTVRPSP